MFKIHDILWCSPRRYRPGGFGTHSGDLPCGPCHCNKGQQTDIMLSYLHTCSPLDNGQNSTRWTSLRKALGIMSDSARRQRSEKPGIPVRSHPHGKPTPCVADNQKPRSDAAQRMPSYLLQLPVLLQQQHGVFRVRFDNPVFQFKIIRMKRKNENKSASLKLGNFRFKRHMRPKLKTSSGRDHQRIRLTQNAAFFVISSDEAGHNWHRKKKPVDDPTSTQPPLPSDSSLRSVKGEDAGSQLWGGFMPPT